MINKTFSSIIVLPFIMITSCNSIRPTENNKNMPFIGKTDNIKADNQETIAPGQSQSNSWVTRRLEERISRKITLKNKEGKLSSNHTNYPEYETKENQEILFNHSDFSSYAIPISTN